MIFTLSQIISLLEGYKYFFLFPFTILEGPIMTVFAGYFSSLGFLNFWLAYVVIILGDTVGDILYYSLGRWGRAKFFKRWGKYLGINEQRIMSMEKYFKNHAGKTLFFGKFGYGVVGTLLFASGAANVRFNKFIIYTLPATLIKSMLIILVGFYFGYAYQQIRIYLDYASYLMIGTAIVLLAIYIHFQRRAKRMLE